MTREEISDEAARVLNTMAMFLHTDSQDYVRYPEIREALEVAGIRIIEIYEKYK